MDHGRWRNSTPFEIGDVLLLIGITLLVGTLFIQEWDIPTKVDAGDDPFEGNSRTFSGDVIDITVLANNASDVRIEVLKSEEVYDETLFCDDSTPAKVSYESKGGQ